MLDRNIAAVTAVQALDERHVRPTRLNELGHGLGSLNNCNSSPLRGGTGLVPFSWQKHSSIPAERCAPQLIQATKGTSHSNTGLEDFTCRYLSS